MENYRQRYQDRAFLPPSYGKRVAQLVARFREKYRIDTRPPPRAQRSPTSGRCRLWMNNWRCSEKKDQILTDPVDWFARSEC